MGKLKIPTFFRGELVQISWGDVQQKNWKLGGIQINPGR